MNVSSGALIWAFIRSTSTPRINKNCTNGLGGTKWNSPWWMASSLASWLGMQRETRRSKDRRTAKSHRKQPRFQDCFEALQMAVVNLKQSTGLLDSSRTGKKVSESLRCLRNFSSLEIEAPNSNWPGALPLYLKICSCDKCCHAQSFYRSELPPPRAWQ